MQSTPEILVLWTRLNAETDQKQELSEISKRGISDSSIFTVDSFPIYFERFPHFFLVRFRFSEKNSSSQFVDRFPVIFISKYFWSVSDFQQKVMISDLLMGCLFFTNRSSIFLVRFYFSEKVKK